MKKLLTAIFAVLYLIISSGFTLHFHYCMGKESGWSLFHINKNKCSICGMPKSHSKGCCKDETKTVKFSSDQKTTDQSGTKILQLTTLTGFPVAEISSSIPQIEYRNLNNLSPPHWRSVSVFIYDCSFRI